ncbi:hypothetical protein ACIPJS_39445 [Streptomyces sp. NPDC086783]|uniref:hypothetical protein n=1 Tax=Streptomyces sp. NPDC086783 TaxID=3365758 RepID=UPI00380137CA
MTNTVQRYMALLAALVTFAFIPGQSAKADEPGTPNFTSFASFNASQNYDRLTPAVTCSNDSPNDDLNIPTSQTQIRLVAKYADYWWKRVSLVGPDGQAVSFVGTDGAVTQSGLLTFDTALLDNSPGSDHHYSLVFSEAGFLGAAHSIMQIQTDYLAQDHVAGFLRGGGCRLTVTWTEL